MFYVLKVKLEHVLKLDAKIEGKAHFEGHNIFDINDEQCSTFDHHLLLENVSAIQSTGLVFY